MLKDEVKGVLESAIWSHQLICCCERLLLPLLNSVGLQTAGQKVGAKAEG